MSLGRRERFVKPGYSPVGRYGEAGWLRWLPVRMRSKVCLHGSRVKGWRCRQKVAFEKWIDPAYRLPELRRGEKRGEPFDWEEGDGCTSGGEPGLTLFLNVPSLVPLLESRCHGALRAFPSCSAESSFGSTSHHCFPEPHAFLAHCSVARLISPSFSKSSSSKHIVSADQLELSNMLLTGR